MKAIIVAFAGLIFFATPVFAEYSDTDGDGVIDPLDNCLEVANPNQTDPGLDGFGVKCDADYDDDGLVGFSDAGILGMALGLTSSDPGFDPDLDHTEDGVIDWDDYGVFAAPMVFGYPPGPSGLECAGQAGCDASVVDQDGDGIPNSDDNCLIKPNPDQFDANGDGYGNLCDADLDNDGEVTMADFEKFKCAFGSSDPEADFDNDGIVGVGDFGLFELGFPGPSGTETTIDETFDSLGDADGDGIPNYLDNCLNVANVDQANPDEDAYGLACDADYDQDEDVDEDDLALFAVQFGLTTADPDFDPNFDHDQDGIIGWLDFGVSELGPTGLFCVPPPDNPPPFPTLKLQDLSIRVVRGSEHVNRLISLDGRGEDPHTFTVTVPPATGSLDSFDMSTGDFAYVSSSDPAVFTDSFEVSVSDGEDVANAMVEMEIWEPLDETFSSTGLNDHVIVVYNENSEGAIEIANHYISARGIAAARLCAIEMPNGLYAHRDHMLAARDRIVEDCICPAIPVSERPSPCNVNNRDAIAAVSPVTHMALVRGIPARMYGTDWPTDFEEPSLDYYLAYSLYNEEDLFAPGTDGDVDTIYQPHESVFGSALSLAYLRGIFPIFHRAVAYGRIEAINKDRTIELIDRTLAAESAGFVGNVFTERLEEHDRLRGRVGSLASECTDSYFDGTSWTSSGGCRAGTTETIAEGNIQSGGVPGEPNTTLPIVPDAGLFLGHFFKSNSQRGFDGIETLKNWRRSEVSCNELCSEFTNPPDSPSPEELACVASSTDFFKELNTDCVGAAPGLVGQQFRSYPVSYYGFFPPGWSISNAGPAPVTPPEIRDSGGFVGGPFTDGHYAHYGVHQRFENDTTTCAGGDDCLEVIGVTLISPRLVLSPAVPVDGTRPFVVRLRTRNQANPGAQLRMNLVFRDSAGGKYGANFSILNIQAGSDDWTTREVTIHADESKGADIEKVSLYIKAGILDNVRGWLDLDGIEVIDEESGASLLDVERGSFTFADRDTLSGDYASNAIDRLGAVAWWGSSSHHLTGGRAFPNQHVMAQGFFAGRSLGESVIASGNGMSGIIYGDPLYRLSAAALYFPSDTTSKLSPSTPDGPAQTGRVVEAESLETYRYLYMNVLHGTANLTSVNWSLSTCAGFDEAACDDQGLWSVQMTGTGAVNETPIDWSQDLIDSNVNQPVTIRLRVWNPGDEANALYDFVHIDYQAAGAP